MDTDRLRYFCTIAQTSNIHRAAELLRLSPAALSKSVKLLEDELGYPLLNRSGRGIVLTAEGKRLAERAKPLIEEFNKLKKPLAQTKPALRLGSFEVFTTHFLGPLLTDHLPEMELLLHELVPGKLEEALVDDVVDLGITYVPIPRPEIDFLKVATIEMGVFIRKGPLSSMAFEELPFVIPVIPVQGSPTKVEGLDGWPDHKLPRNILYRVTMMESALELTRRGMCAVTLPTFVVRLHNEKVKPEFQLIPYPKTIPLGAEYRYQPVYLVKRRSETESPIEKKLAKAIRMLCK